MKYNDDVHIRIKYNDIEHDYIVKISILPEEIRSLLLDGFHLLIENSGIYLFKEIESSRDKLLSIQNDMVTLIDNVFGDLNEMEYKGTSITY